MWASKHIKYDFGRGSAPDHSGGAYNAPETPSWWTEAALPKNATPASALRACALARRPRYLNPQLIFGNSKPAINSLLLKLRWSQTASRATLHL